MGFGAARHQESFVCYNRESINMTSLKYAILSATELPSITRSHNNYMSPEDNVNHEKSMESTDANAGFVERFDKMEGLLTSIRLASWVTAIGILALVVYTVQ
jgi:hypothetical protein